jgi:hypothetical protein
MHYSIYQYLKTGLHSALQKAYPQQYPDLESIPITFSSITPDPSIDIATPWPQKIAQFLNLPVAPVSQYLLKHFQINTDILSSTIYTIPDRGFYNFRISQAFLLETVYETSTNDDAFNKISTANRPNIINKIELLLEKSKPENLPSLDQFITFHLPCSTQEYKATRLIALSSLDGIHSAKTCEFFMRKLLDYSDKCYRKCPLQTDDYQLSSLRYFIIRALYARIAQLATIKQMPPMNSSF